MENSGKVMKKLIVLLIIAVCAWYVYENKEDFFSAEETARKSQKDDNASPELEQKVVSFSIDGRSSRGVQQWHLEGESAEIIEEKIHLNNLTAIAYSEDNVINLKSDRGIYSRDDGVVELMGNVEVLSEDGVTLTTESAKWSQATKEISTDTLVTIQKEGLKAIGIGGMANSDKNIAILKKDVVVILDPDTKVNCDGALEVRYDDNVAIFHDNVRVEDKDGKLFADKLIVDFDPESQKLAKVTAEGNVKVKKGNSYTLSERAIYTESTKSAKLEGRPRIIIDPDELSNFEEMEIKSPEDLKNI